jgi:membrane protein
LTAGPRTANIATLMDDPEPASWPRRARERALEIAPRTPGYTYAAGALRHDQRHGGGLLAGALAFRLFGALLPLALLLTVILGYATSVDHDAPKETGEALGLGTTVLESVGESARLSSGTRWSVLAFAVIALLWSANSAARAIRAVHNLAWEGRVGRVRRPLPAALVMLAAIGAFAAVIAGASKARAELGLAGLLVSIVALVAFAAIWLALSWLLPHGDADWKALIPGALLVALGVQVIHLGTVLFVADRIEHSSQTYGSLGVAFTILFWLFVVSRVIVASAMLNAALAGARRPTPEEVLHA